MLIRVHRLHRSAGRSSILHAQSEPTASRLGDLKIGGGFSTANSDYGGRYNGGAAYVDFDFLPHLGVEGEFHFVKDSAGPLRKDLRGRWPLLPHLPKVCPRTPR